MMVFQVHPDHGWHISYNGLEAEANRKNGWKDVTEKEFYDRGKKTPIEVTETVETKPVVESGEETPEEIDEDRQTAAAAYELKFGRKPHHRMNTDTILKAINDDNGQ